MKELVWLKRESWEALQHLLQNIQLRQSPAIAAAAVHYTANGADSKLHLDIPGRKNGYDGMFKVLSLEKDLLTVCDGLDINSPAAGYAYINGQYTEIPSEKIVIDENKLRTNFVKVPYGELVEVKEGYLSLALSPAGKVFFALTPQVVKRVYDGEFAVEYNQKEKALVIVDGSNAKNRIAGSLFCNGIYKKMPSGKLQAKTGTLCIALHSSGRLSYQIISEVEARIYDGEFAVEYDQGTKMLHVFDGMYGPYSGAAGHAFLDGVWTNIPAGALLPKNGYVCLRYSRKDGASFIIVDKPENKSSQNSEN